MRCAAPTAQVPPATGRSSPGEPTDHGRSRGAGGSPAGGSSHEPRRRTDRTARLQHGARRGAARPRGCPHEDAAAVVRGAIPRQPAARGARGDRRRRRAPRRAASRRAASCASTADDRGRRARRAAATSTATCCARSRRARRSTSPPASDVDVDATDGSTRPPLLNIGGLASGLDTNSIVDQLMAIERAPRTQLANQQASLSARRSRCCRTSRRGCARSRRGAQDLRSPTLCHADAGGRLQRPDAGRRDAARPARASAATRSRSRSSRTPRSGPTASRSPASAGTITIDGHDTAVAAGATIQRRRQRDQLRLRARPSTRPRPTPARSCCPAAQTGDTGTGFIAVSDATGALTEQTAKAQAGPGRAVHGRRRRRLVASNTSRTRSPASASRSRASRPSAGRSPSPSARPAPTPTRSSRSCRRSSTSTTRRSTRSARSSTRERRSRTRRTPQRPAEGPAVRRQRADATCSTRCARRSTRRSPACRTA